MRGSNQILSKFARERPDHDWPARSMVDEILRRAGIVTPRGKRPRRQPKSPRRVEALAPNDDWFMANIGWLRVGEGGPPFGSRGLSRLSRLGRWLVRLGEPPVLIEPVRTDGSILWDGGW